MHSVCLAMIIKDNLGGAERRLTRTFDALQCNVDILIYDRSKDGRLFYEFEQFRTERRATLKQYTSSLTFLWAIFWGDYEWVSYFDCSGTYPIIPIIAKLTRKKRLWILASTIFTNINNTNRRQRKIVSRFYGYPTHVDCLYPSRTGEIQKLIRKGISCTTTPCPFTDLKRFKPNKEKRRKIVFSGRMIGIKHPLEFLKAIQIVAGILRDQNYEVYMCGNGPMLTTVQQTVKKYKLEDIVVVTGYINTEAILAESRVFVSLQDYNNYPSQSLIEAIASGCWCIASNVGDTSILVKSTFGELVDIEADSIAAAIERAIGIQNFDEVVENARAFAEETFQITKSVEYYNGILS